MNRTHRIALDVNHKQESLLKQHCGYARVAWNDALGLSIESRDTPGPWLLDHRSLRPAFNAVKREQHPWCADLSQNAAKNAIIDLGLALKRWIACRKGECNCTNGRHFRHPRRRTLRRTGYTFQADNGPGTVRVDGRRLQLPRIGWLRTRECLRFPGTIVKCVVKQDGDRWFACLTVKDPLGAPEPGTATGEVLGVDLGVKAIATINEEKEYANPKPFATLQKEIARLQRKIARSRYKNEGKVSKRCQDLYKQLGRLQRKAANVRRDFQHKATTEIVKRASALGLETLNVSGMLRNRKLARALSDAALYAFTEKLLYKSEARGVIVTRADRFWPSTKTCSGCGHRKAHMDLSMRTYACHACGLVMDRDANAAANLKQLAERSPVSEAPRPRKPGLTGVSAQICRD